MIIRAKIVGDLKHPLDAIPFKNGDIVTLKVENGLYDLLQELGDMTASDDIDVVFEEMR